MRLPTDPTCVLVQMRATTHAETAVYRRMHRHSFGHVGLSQIASVAQSVEARLDEVPARAMESTQLQVVHSGTLILEQGGTQTRFGAGELAIYDASRPFSFVYPDEFRTTIVQVPTVLLSARGVLPAPLGARSVDAGSTGRRELEGLLRGSVGRGARPPRDPAALSPRIVRAARLMVDEELGVARERNAPAARLAAEAMELLHQEYADPGLTAAALAARLHVSLRTLFAAFEDADDSLASTLRTVRLGAAERLLLTTRLPIAEVAHAVGYADVTAFIRAWKAATGSTPARWRRLVTGAVDTDAGTDTATGERG